MKTCHFILRFFVTMGILIIFASSSAFSAGGDEARDVVLTYFDALKNGDVQTVKAMLTDPMLSSRRLILEKNTAYPDYLRDFYRDATLEIVGVKQVDDSTQVVDASITFAGDANPLNIRFTLKYLDANWKISNDTRTPG